jgi:spermidine/putrescine transport system ATP-binding protein
MQPRDHAIDIQNVTRRFGEVIALDNISLTIHSGEFFSLLGPSGCGKTTLLRIIAGLELIDSGSVRMLGQDCSGLPAHKRPVNTVFQSYALFPHLDVWENIAFGLRMKKTPQKEMERRVGQVLALAEIEPLARRRPNQLSGGQKQRVALARAIVNEPKVLLLDEPLAALDLKLRKQLQLELLQLQKRLAITFIYVTHDQEEAMVLSDRIAVMRSGKIEQLGTAADLYERPRTRFTSQFLGSCTLIEAKIRERGVNASLVDTVFGDLTLRAPLPAGEKFTLAIRPEKIEVASNRPADPENVIPGTIEQVIYTGAGTHYLVSAAGQSVRVEVMNSADHAVRLNRGQQVWVRLAASGLIPLDD